jgi:hypothetical protein
MNSLFFFSPQKKNQKSSRDGFEVGGLPTTFLTLSFPLKIPNSLTLRQSDFLNEKKRVSVSSADFSKKSQAVTHLYKFKSCAFYNSASPSCAE